MRRVWPYIALIHPWAVLVVMLATALFGLLAAGGRPDPARYALLLAGMLGGQVAIGALNEYRDRELDARAKPWRPLPSGAVTPTAARRLVALGLLVMTGAGLLLGLAPLLVLLILTGAGLAYDLWFKATRWSWLPYLVALPLLPSWVWLTLGRPAPRLLLLYPLGAPMVLAVHLAQSLSDAESDRAAGAGSLVARLGRREALALLGAAALLACLEIALFALWLSARPAPALLAAVVSALLLAGALAADRLAPRLLDRYLFHLTTLLTIALGAGWVLSAGL
ncbi:MAG TPA: UbiA family prenyltransferase [Nitrolancea sp.]|nr:UbiA family prenyltransferase [Nitrolancea sp.]